VTEGRGERAWRRVRAWLPAPLGRLVDRLRRRELLLEASSLAFYGLVSALPLLVLAFSFVGAVAGEETLQQIAQQAEENGPAGAGRILEQLIDSGDTLSWAALVFTIWPATAYGGGLRRALGRAAEDSGGAPALRGRLTALLMVFALPVLVLGGLPLVALLTSLQDDGLAGTVLGWGLAIVVGGGGLTLLLSLLYRIFTPARIGWGHVLRGAALAAAVTSLFSVAFVAYLRIGDVEDRFGGDTIGLVVMLGVYLFVANALLLGGFEAAAELEEGADAADGDGSDVSRR
jgi:membrane protein